MTTKKKALKALLILACVLLLCMFFARTVQTITTAKVQRIQATRGRLEDRIEVKGEVFFSEAEPFTVDDARKLNITVDKVMARPGYLIKEGDALFTASVPTFGEEVDKIKTTYDTKVRELTAAIAKSIRLPQESDHNRVYNELLSAAGDYYDKLYLAEAAAMEANYELPTDVAQWSVLKEPIPTATPRGQRETPTPEPTETPAPTATPEPTPSPEPGATPDPAIERQRLLEQKVKQAMQDAYDAKVLMDETEQTLKRIYQGGSPIRRTGDAVYEHIQKLDVLRVEIAGLNQQMLDLNELKLGLQRVTAPREGWLMSMDVKQGESYNGTKAAYSLSLPGETPVLRCDITEVKKPLQKGMKATISGSEQELTIDDIIVTADNKKFAIITLDKDTLSALGGLSKLMAEQQTVNIMYRAQRTTTLIPASALRSEGENKYYVYVVQQQWGGMLSNTNYTVKKQDVKVLETSQKLASLEDDLSYVEIADREDRPLTDGQTVMEYVD